jgi:hypothetical protein|tara:strand:- start:1137 stop:1547 length:411 start_codon:yes stop_codon:yes gene_type:complete
MDTKILKLTNGDEIITTLSAVKDTSVVTAHNPLKINSYPRVSKTGIEESMALSRWVSYGENDSCEIIKNNIVAVTTASIGIAKFYEFCILRMKKGKDALLAEQEPTPEQLRRLEEEMDEEMMDEYFDDYDTSKTIH